jgi:molybdopterin-binding protein
LRCAIEDALISLIGAIALAVFVLTLLRHVPTPSGETGRHSLPIVSSRPAEREGHATQCSESAPGDGEVSETGAVMAEVVIDTGGQELVAAITADSGERLSFAKGKAVTVIIKATDVLVARIRSNALGVKRVKARTEVSVPSGT